MPLDSWNLTSIPPELLASPPDSRLEKTVARASTFHRDSTWDTLFSYPLIADTGLSDVELADLQERLGRALPPEFSLVLSRWRYLNLFDGFGIWDPSDAFIEDDLLDKSRDQIFDRAERESRAFLFCGDCWRRADGDAIIIDLDDSSFPVYVWCHDAIEIEPLAASLSLALARIVEYLFCAEHYNEAVAQVRKDVRLSHLPWWKKIWH